MTKQADDDQARKEKQDAKRAASEPLWVRFVNDVERAIARPVEAAVRSDEYFDLVTQLSRARARVTKTVEAVSEEWLHLFNLPAATDLRRVREQLARVERQLNRVAKTLGDSDEASEEPRRQLAHVEEQLASIAEALGATETPRKTTPRSQRQRRQE